MLKTIKKGVHIFEDTLLIAGLLSAAFVLFANVVMRYFFKTGLVWAEEFARYAIIWIVCGGCGAAVRENMHMRITAIIDMTKSPRLHFVINIIAIISGAIFAVFLLYYGSRLTGSMITNRQLSPAMEIPLWWIYISIPIGGGLMCFHYAQSFCDCVKKYKKGDAR